MNTIDKELCSNKNVLIGISASVVDSEIEYEVAVFGDTEWINQVPSRTRSLERDKRSVTFEIVLEHGGSFQSRHISLKIVDFALKRGDVSLVVPNACRETADVISVSRDICHKRADVALVRHNA